MYLTSLHYASRTGNEHVPEFAPVFLVVINHQRDLWMLFNIAQALELGGRASFGFFVDGRVEVVVVEYEADRNHVRLTGSIGRGEMGDTGRAD